MTPATQRIAKPTASSAFRGAVLRGLGVVLPPLLTIVIFLWIGGTVQTFVLEPVTSGAQRLMIWWVGDIRRDDSLDNERSGGPGVDRDTVSLPLIRQGRVTFGGHAKPCVVAHRDGGSLGAGQP